MSGGGRHRARMAAVQALYQWDLTEQSAGDIESHFIYEHNLADTDLEYFQRIVRRVPRHHHELDDALQPHLGRDFGGVDPVERAILRVAAYELRFEPEIPYRVVIDEAIELAKTFGAEHSYRFVNGVLDKVALTLREAETRSC